jgi:hypothetical protein
VLIRSVEVPSLLPGPTRRRVLIATGLGFLLATGLSGCTPDDAAAPVAVLEPDELAVDRAITAARRLQADAVKLAGEHHDLAVLLNRIASVHAAHLRALGASATTTAPTPTTATPSTPGTSPAPVVASPAQLVRAEWAAARTALGDGEAAAPAFAVLLCRIAAALAVNADLLNTANHGKPILALTPIPAAAAVPAAEPISTDLPTDPADPPAAEATTPVLSALNRLLAGEHAAVFAYPLIIARGGKNRRTSSTALWQAHRAERDDLEVRLLAAGVAPVTAEPAYEVGTPPTTSARAAALAARIERGLAALATDVIAASAAPSAAATTSPEAAATGPTGGTSAGASAAGATAAGSATTAATPAPRLVVDPYRALGAGQLVLAARRTAAWTARPAAFPGQSAAQSAQFTAPSASPRAAAAPTPVPTPS